MIRRFAVWLEDQILYRLQRRCPHPGRMVAADILEGSFESIEVKYCRRCGAVKTDWNPRYAAGHLASLDHCWRLPDPNLWRG
jgi:hypothetical protein